MAGPSSRPTLLLDGLVRATWKLARTRKDATLVIEPFEPLPEKHATAASEEAARLLAFLAPDAEAREVCIVEG